MEIISASKKEPLSRTTLACQGEVQTLNMTRGCAGQCAFCYARAFPGDPSPGQLMVYNDLPGQLRSALTSTRRRLPRWVLVNSASDAFLGGDEVLKVTRKCLETLVKHRVGISMSTRGMIPEDLVDLLGRHARHSRVIVPLASMDTQITRAWEPGTIMPQQRLLLVRRLMDAGLHPRVRLDPLIPFVNDTTAQLRALLSAISGIGLSSVTLSFMHLRPGVADQVKEEGPAEQIDLVLGSFTAPDQGGRYLRVALNRVRASFEKIKNLGKEYGVTVTACRCQTPGLTAHACPVLPPEMPVPVGEQGQLSFGEEPPE